jgi:aspartate carbamoyltransferase catalytic subunit
MAKRDLLSIDDLTRAEAELILETAESFLPVLQRDIKKVPTLRGRTIINMFYESSTRTLTSFELAAKRLSADTMNVRAAGSAVDKGESLKDTILTLSAYQPDIIVMRHPQIGACLLASRFTQASVINAGDGKFQHPSQCLLDLFTMRQALGRELDGKKVWIVGDILHSRVARSDIAGFQLLGMDVTVAGPPSLIPRDVESLGVSVEYSLDRLAEADVVYLLRMQMERMQEGANFIPSLREYSTLYGMTLERLRSGQKVMHPGPINRGVEISPEVADHPDTLILEQVEAGLAVRMAILYRTIAGYDERSADERGVA